MVVFVSLLELGVIVAVLAVLGLIGLVLGTKVLQGYNDAMGYSNDEEE